MDTARSRQAIWQWDYLTLCLYFHRLVDALSPPESKIDFNSKTFQPAKIPAFVAARERERIGVFLNKAMEIGVPEANLFQTDYLYEKTCLVQVCACIRALGIEVSWIFLWQIVTKMARIVLLCRHIWRLGPICLAICVQLNLVLVIWVTFCDGLWRQSTLSTRTIGCNYHPDVCNELIMKATSTPCISRRTMYRLHQKNRQFVQNRTQWVYGL